MYPTVLLWDYTSILKTTCVWGAILLVKRAMGLNIMSALSVPQGFMRSVITHAILSATLKIPTSLITSAKVLSY